MKTAKYFGVVYEVKPTGKRMNKPAKSYYDFNGYWTERPAERWEQIGLYHNGELVYTLGRDGKSIFQQGHGKSVGAVSVYDTELDKWAHKIETFN